MIIGIDAHNLEGQRTGVGSVLISILQQWSNLNLPQDLKIILYFKSEIPKDIGSEFQKKLFNVSSNVLFMHYHLPQAVKKDKVDVLFCPGYIAPVFYKGKIALTLHDIIYQARPELYSWPSIWDKILLKKVSQISAKKAAVIFVPSEYSKSEVLKYYKVEPDKVFVIPLAANSVFRQIHEQGLIRNLKNKYQIKDKFILFIGSIFNRRHLPEVIKAFGKVAQKLPNYQFLIVGANHTAPFIDIDGLAKQVNQRLNREAILRQKYIKGDDLPVLYNAADLLIWLSDYEGFGLPILEAMACATPVITSSVTSVPEVAGEAAIYVKDNSDINEIYEAIYRGLTDDNLRQDLIEKALIQAKKFSWQRCAQQTLDALLSL